MIPGTQAIAELIRTPGGTLILRPKPGIDLKLAPIAELRPQCDGSLALVQFDEWITPGEAVKLTGLSESSVLRLLTFIKPDGRAVLIHRRPTPFRIQIQLRSVLELLKQTEENNEYWAACTPNARPLQPRETAILGK